ncbi:ribose 1,5-bisphosphate isomerase [Natrialbaceae archaeon A-chndr2]
MTPDVAPTVEETATDIAEMEVRGAATIADAAAAALADQAEASTADTPAAFRADLEAAATELYRTRPTAVSLPNALRYVLRGLEPEDDRDGEESKSVDRLRTETVARARRFQRDLEQAQDTLGSVGANRLRDGDVVMTHCHSTDALACIEAAVDDGKHIEAIVKETRPRLQGHITARALREMGVPVTLIVDNAARRYLDDTDHVLVGADSIAADGSVINKIGTSGLAVNARERGVPVMVAAQSIKLHPDTMTGHTVEIEMRDEREVLEAEDYLEIATDETSGAKGDGADGDVTDEGRLEAVDGGLSVENPAFDVTPPRHVDAIVTEHGQYPPESVVVLMRELFGETTTDPWRA